MKALGYRGRGTPKDHSEYLMAKGKSAHPRVL